jgi:hypothetical protein
MAHSAEHVRSPGLCRDLAAPAVPRRRRLVARGTRDVRRGRTLSANTRASRPKPHHMREILANVHAPGVLRAFEASTPQEAAALLDAAPRQEVIELGDSAHRPTRLASEDACSSCMTRAIRSCARAVWRIRPALPCAVHAGRTTYAVTSLFDHVQPKNVVTWDALAQGLRLYGFLERIASALSTRSRRHCCKHCSGIPIDTAAGSFTTNSWST